MFLKLKDTQIAAITFVFGLIKMNIFFFRQDTNRFKIALFTMKLHFSKFEGFNTSSLF